MEQNTVCLISLGCPKNKVDAEVMLGDLVDHGYRVVMDPAEADVIIVNTCGFIEDAKVESIDTILEMAEYKETGRCRVLMMSGCLSQRYHEDLLNELPEVDGFVGVTQYKEMHRHVEAALEGQRVDCCELKPEVIGGGKRLLSTPAHVGYIKIAEGCDNRCSYCAIPAIRGGYRSRPMEELQAEAEALVAQGVKELIVIAQDTTRYGVDLYGESLLGELLTNFNKIEGVKWIRVLYLYPELLTDELLNTMASLEHVCNYVDLPLQHVNDDVLKAMNRRSSRAQIERIMQRVRAMKERFVVRTTMIVGFPGETYEAFNELADFIEKHPFDLLGAFIYSAEEGTPAATMDDQIDPEEAAERLDELMLRQRTVSLYRQLAYMGTEQEAVIEGYDPEQELYVGRISLQSPDIDGITYISSEEELPEGTFVRVRIVDATDYDLIGEVIV